MQNALRWFTVYLVDPNALYFIDVIKSNLAQVGVHEVAENTFAELMDNFDERFPNHFIFCEETLDVCNEFIDRFPHLWEQGYVTIANQRNPKAKGEYMIEWIQEQAKAKGFMLVESKMERQGILRKELIDAFGGICKDASIAMDSMNKVSASIDELLEHAPENEQERRALSFVKVMDERFVYGEKGKGIYNDFRHNLGRDVEIFGDIIDASEKPKDDKEVT